MLGGGDDATADGRYEEGLIDVRILALVRRLNLTSKSTAMISSQFVF